ncbi:MAG: polymer-forming cytoskeletal protein [Gemmatimonadota bacterium]|jgi:cytoskeletal protein CcmA (bactofilin family)
MWKKDEVAPPEPATPKFEDKPRSPTPPPPTSPPAERAVIGQSISIVGEVKGGEDLLIQGRIEGTVDLRDQLVTVGPEGDVKADVTGRVVSIEGRVEGNLQAGEQIILRSSAKVQGDITAPRVVLEDGARFRGLVDMGDPAKSEKSADDRSALQSKKASEASKSKGSGSGETSKSSGNSGKALTETESANTETAQVAVS